MDSHTKRRPFSGIGISDRNSYHGLLASFHAGSDHGSLPSFAPTSVNGKINFHALQSLWLDHPQTRVGFAWILASTTSVISTTVPSTLMAHLRPFTGSELKLSRSSLLWYSISENLVRWGGEEKELICSLRIRSSHNVTNIINSCPRASNCFFTLHWGLLTRLSDRHELFGLLSNFLKLRRLWAWARRPIGLWPTYILYTFNATSNLGSSHKLGWG